MTSSKKLAIAAVTVTATAVAGALVAAVNENRAKGRHPPKGQFVGPREAKIHYVQAGRGPDVVLIHGAAVSLDEMLAGPWAALTGRYRVTAFDRPGHGHSDGDPANASPIQQAEKLHAAITELGLDRPTIVGHSLGGAVALAYGEAYPGQVSGIVAVAPLAFPGWGPGHISPALHAAPVAGELLSKSVFALTDPILMRAAYRLLFSPQKIPARFRNEFPRSLAVRPEAMRADGVDLIAASRALHAQSRRYVSYPAAVHVLVGDQDRILKPVRQAERLTKALGEAARLTTIKGAGHMVHHAAPEALVAAIEEVRGRAGALAAPLRDVA